MGVKGTLKGRTVRLDKELPDAKDGTEVMVFAPDENPVIGVVKVRLRYLWVVAGGIATLAATAAGAGWKAADWLSARKSPPADTCRADSMDSNDLFPEFGPAALIANNVRATLDWTRLPCANDCIGGATRALELHSFLRRDGFGVLLMKKPPGATPQDLSKRPLHMRAVVRSESRTVEIGLLDDASTTIFFHCKSQAPAAQAEDFLIDVPGAVATHPEFHADRVRQISFGFASGAGARPGDHEIRVLGIEATPNQLSAPRCELVPHS